MQIGSVSQHSIAAASNSSSRESSTVDLFMYIHIHAQSSQFSNFKANLKPIPNPLLLHQYLTCECQTKFNFEPKKNIVRERERDEKSLILIHENYPPLKNDKVLAHHFFFSTQCEYLNPVLLLLF